MERSASCDVLSAQEKRKRTNRRLRLGRQENGRKPSALGGATPLSGSQTPSVAAVHGAAPHRKNPQRVPVGDWEVSPLASARIAGSPATAAGAFGNSTLEMPKRPSRSL